jgi:dipeptidyl aminopeptidase/acylaminoacyl peptidase
MVVDSGSKNAERTETPLVERLEESVVLMAKIGRCSSPSFSPDGTRLVFVTNLNGIPQIWTVPTQGGWPELVTTLDDQILDVKWSPDGKWLAFLLAPGGGMNQQIYLARPDGREVHRLTDGGKENNWLGEWILEGDMLAMMSNRRSTHAMDAYFIDVESGELKLVIENKGVGGVLDVSADGKWAIFYRMLHRSDDNLFLVNLENGDELLLTPHKGPGSFRKGRFSADGKSIYLSSNKDREMVAFAKIALGENFQPGEIDVIIGKDNAELQDFEITEDGRKGILLWNFSGNNRLEFINLATNGVAPGPELPVEIVSGITISKNGRQLALTLSGAASPWDIYVYDMDEDRLWQVTRSPHAGVDLSMLTRPTLAQFKAHDELELSGWLYVPDDFDAPGPLVLSFHGGPEGQEQPIFNNYYQALLSQGVAILAPNVRGSAGFGKSFVNLDNGPLRFNAIKDIKSCWDYVVESGVADPKRVAIMGGSYGGYMTMAGLTEYPDLFAAGANIFGVVNFETFFENTEPWMAEISKIQYGDPKTQRDLLRSLSPIHKIDHVTAPTIVVHGANDTNVPVVEAEQVVENLKARDVDVKYILFPDEGHGFTKIPNVIQAIVEITRWFVTYLTK